ncbi:MAG: right-handed parallel beta-helix repeat-containing protein [Candidatus Limnocylindria bacterium]
MRRARAAVTAALSVAMVVGQYPAALLAPLAPDLSPLALAVTPAEIKVLDVGTHPRGVAVNHLTHRAYVANWDSGNVTVVQLGSTPGSSAVAATVAVGTQPFGLGVNTATNKVYVANQGSNTVSVINGDTNAVVTTIAVGSGPVAVAANPVTNRIYVANNAGEGNTISVIDGATDEVAATITVPGNFVKDVAVNSATNRISVVANAANAMYVINGATNEVIATVSLVSVLGDGPNPRGLAVNETTDQAWIAVINGVIVVNGETNAIAHVISNTDNRAIVVNPAANRAYVAGVPTAVDGATRSLDPITGGAPNGEGVGVDRSSGFVVLSDFGANSVQVVLEPPDVFVPRAFVNVTGDAASADDGSLTLREAMTYVSGSSSPGPGDRRQISGGGVGAESKDTVRFLSSAFPAGSATVIALSGGSGLPPLRGGDSIEGNPGGVVIDGSRLTPSGDPAPRIDGLTISGSGSAIRAVEVRGFSGRGMFVGDASASPPTEIAQNIVTGNGSTGLELFKVVGAHVHDNVIAGNGCHGAYLGATTGVTLANNKIGTLEDGTTAAGNTCAGVVIIDNSPDATSSDNILTNNVIAHNSDDGVFINVDSDRNVLTGNTIHGNGRGISVGDAASSGNRIEAGSISGNAGKGIALASGANGGIQPPEITDVRIADQLIVSGTSGAGATIQIYADPEDEGLDFLGSTTADAEGNWTKESAWVHADMSAIQTAVKAGTRKLHATQTDTDGNTSEFSGVAPEIESVLSGIARCLIGDEIEGGTSVLLPGGTVELFSGQSLVASTTADQVTAAFEFEGVAAGTYTLRFTGANPSPPPAEMTCGAEVVIDADGGMSVGSAALPIDLHNHSWPKAYRLDPLGAGGGPIVIHEHIARQDESAWFKFTVRPGSRAIVTLTDLPANYDLTMYKDIARAYATITSQQDLLQLGAEFAPDAFSPDAFSPDAFSPDAFSPDAFSPDAFSPDAFSPDAFSPDAFSPDAFSPDAFSPDAYSPDAFSPDAFSPDAFSPDAFSPDAYSPDAFSPDAYSGAQTRSLIAVSAFGGTSGEGIARFTWDNEGDFYVRVRGRNGAFSLAAPFRLAVVLLTGTCAPVNPITVATSHVASAGSYRTLILTDVGRTEGTAEEISALQSRLATFSGRSEVKGFVVDVGGDARVAAANTQADANPACPYAKSLAAHAIKAIVDAYRALNPSLEYLVLAGSGHALAQFPEKDDAGLANERNYVPPVRDPTPPKAALGFGYFLSDDRYGATRAVSRSDTTLPLQDLAIGRLVQTAAEMTGVVDAYLATASGVRPIGAAPFVSGYDFIANGAEAIRAELEAGTARPADALILAGHLPPTDPGAWTGGQLRDALLAVPRDIAFVGGHGSAFSLLAADYQTRFLAREVAESTADLTNLIVFSIGCHIGYPVLDAHGIVGVTPEPDWPQAFARKRATLIAGTAYQYGETEFIEYGERLYLEFARKLRTGTGPVSVGKALLAAKQAYLAATAQLRGIHVKTVLQTTIFGLPHLSVDMPGARLPVPSDASIVAGASAVVTNPGAQLSPASPLGTADVTITPSLTVNTLALTDVSTGSPVSPSATYLAGTSGVVANPAEPVLPLELRNVSLAGAVLRGAGFRGGAYADVTGVRPLTGAPATEVRGVHGPFVSSVFYPIRPWSVNYLGALAGGATRLAVTPSQFVSDAPDSPTGTRRQFSSLAFRLYYSTHLGAAAAAASPAIARVSGVPQPDGTVRFDVNVTGDPGAGIQHVWITYTGTSGAFNGTWTSLDLSQDGVDSRLWTGSLGPASTAAADVRYIVQAANGVGLVTLATNLGAYYVPGPDTVPIGSPKAATALALQSPPAGGQYREARSFSALLTSGGDPLAGRSLTFGLGSERRRATTGANGVATATLPLLQTPGDYEVRVSFSETAEHLGSSAAAPFVIAKQGTQLALEPSCEPLGATLRDTSNSDPNEARRLRDHTVFFNVSGAGEAHAAAVITDFAGRAPLGAVPLPAGVYTVVASFGAAVVAGGTTLTLTNDRYQGSSVSASLDLKAADPVVTYTGETVVELGTSLDLAATLAGTRAAAASLVCFTVRDGAGQVVDAASAPVASGAASASISGLRVGVYAIEAVAVGGSQAAGLFGSAAATALLAVYDPAAGFVTGGGWITSPEGAFTADPSLTGRATFGFVSKYQKGAQKPVGRTEFQFRVAKFTFQSDDYDWLVISGARAQYKGAGTVNGAGEYGFLLTAIDGQLKGGGGADKFRIKIWDRASGTVVYDNQLGADDAGDPSTVIGGGSIVIHSK